MWTLLPSVEKTKYGNLETFIYDRLDALDVTFEDFCETQINRIRRNLVPYTGGHPKILKQWVEENLGVEFNLNEEFETKLKEYLSEGDVYET